MEVIFGSSEHLYVKLAFHIAVPGAVSSTLYIKTTPSLPTRHFPNYRWRASLLTVI